MIARPDKAQIIATTCFLKARSAIREIAHRRWIGAVYGDAGLGKTFSVEVALEEIEGVEVCKVDIPLNTTPRLLCQTLIHALTGVYPVGERFKLQQDLLRILSEKPRLLVIDEAQYLTKSSIEAIRHLHDNPCTDFGVALVGGHQCEEVLRRFPMLSSRTKRWVEFSAMEEVEVLEIMPLYHPLLAKTKPEILIEVNDFAQGVWREWEAFVFDAIDSCAEGGLRAVDGFVLRDVFQRRGGGREAA